MAKFKDEPDPTPPMGEPTDEDRRRADTWIQAIYDGHDAWALLNDEQREAVRARIRWARPDHAVSNLDEMHVSGGTVRDSLVEAVGEDAAVSVALWLSDVLDAHSLEVNDREVSPSVAWLAEAVARG